MQRQLSTFLVATAIGLVAISSASAELTLPHFFSDHMVLQQEKPVVIWGHAEADSEVEVRFAGESATSTSNDAGAWKVTLRALSARREGSELTITSGNESKTLTDVLVGEVWLASGQSNMA